MRLWVCWGNRLFERNAVVGDVRVLRRDFSTLWFIAGNHVMTTLWLRATLRRWLRGG